MKYYFILFFEAYLRNLHTSALPYEPEVILSLVSNSLSCYKVRNKLWWRTQRQYHMPWLCLLLIANLMAIPSLRLMDLAEEEAEIVVIEVVEVVEDTIVITMVVILHIRVIHLKIKVILHIRTIHLRIHA